MVDETISLLANIAWHTWPVQVEFTPDFFRAVPLEQNCISRIYKDRLTLTWSLNFRWGDSRALGNKASVNLMTSDADHHKQVAAEDV